MATDIELKVKTCERCTRRKARPEKSTSRKAPLVNIVVTRPLELVCIDFLSLEPDSSNTKDVLVITDHFTKYALTLPTPNQKARTVARFLWENFISHYGFPERLHSDQGPDFESRTLKELCQLAGIRKVRTTPYHPRGNPVDQFNRTLLGMLGTLENHKKTHWREHVRPLVHAYNCTKNEVTGFTPYELMFGRQPRLPVDLAFGLPVDHQPSSHSEYVRNLKSSLESSYKIATEYESARSKPVGSRKRKASDTEQLPTKRLKESTDEEEDPKLEFEAKYVELNPLGEGGCGSVFNGYRKSDKLVVAINGRELSVEVAVMLKLQSGTSNSAGSKAPITLLDWYVLPHELILVLERPMPAPDLQSYIERRGGSLKESEAKIILKQLVEAAIHLQDEKIFHRDIKLENILIEMCSGAPRVRIIDFGLSCFTQKNSNHNTFYGTDCHVPPEWLFWYQYSAGPTTVWQLGIVLFECLHNKRFNSSSFIKRKIKINNRLSKDCKDFLRQCFTRDPKERPSLEQIRLHPWLN
uniref:non-specific serine/threonine protein kinase n=1 Tax=Oryzias latipes TaxID=8090 RepID=A0A3B3IN64_ORYLA